MSRKTVLVAGASRGIGKAIAIKFARKGYNVVISCIRNEDRLMQTIQRFEGLTKNYIHDFNQESRMLEILQQLSAAQETSVSVQKKYRTRFLISSGEKLFISSPLP